ncbi:MAG: hypothetical protein GX362_02375 [Methanosarcinaceae archaeon]|nr:hypothetical protein [Methanosarcinaceae archaeon]
MKKVNPAIMILVGFLAVLTLFGIIAAFTYQSAYEVEPVANQVGQTIEMIKVFC